jgi:copper chaperone CopZ
MGRRSILFGIGCMALLFVVSMAHAAEPAATTISIKGMQCAGCAGHVAESLQAIPGVAKAHADATKATAVVTAKSKMSPSPRALWEAVEKAGYTPVKLVSPAGTFTSKPQQ